MPVCSDRYFSTAITSSGVLPALGDGIMVGVGMALIIAVGVNAIAEP
jgi:hypothetical protein